MVSRMQAQTAGAAVAKNRASVHGVALDTAAAKAGMTRAVAVMATWALLAKGMSVWLHPLVRHPSLQFLLLSSKHYHWFSSG